METVKRWIENLKWLFNHPAHITTTMPEGTVCHYCGATTGFERHGEDMMVDTGEELCICWRCKKKVFDLILEKT